MSNQGKQRLYTGQKVRGFCSVWSFKEMPTFLGIAHSWVWMQTMPLISCAMADMLLNLCKPRDRHLDNGMKSLPSHGVVMRGKTENVWLQSALVDAMDLPVPSQNSYGQALTRYIN